MKKFFKNLWHWLDNNKTILCLAIATIIEKLLEYKVVPSLPIFDFLQWLFLAIATGAFAHHVKKGNFKWPTSDKR